MMQLLCDEICEATVNERTLTEGRKELWRQYVENGKVPGATFKQLEELDPTGQKRKYLGWILARYVDGYRDKAQYEVLKDFEELTPRKKIKGQDADIGRYKSPEAVFDAVKKFEAPSKSEQKADLKSGRIDPADVVYENEQVWVVKPKTKQDSCRYGAGTKWCTATGTSYNYFNSYYYGEKVTLYYVIRKEPQDDVHDKLAVAVYPDGRREYFDMEDVNLDDEYAREVIEGMGVPF